MALFLTFAGYAQAQTAQAQSTGPTLLVKAQALHRAGRSDSSILVYRKAIGHLKTENDYPNLFRAYGSITLPLYALGQFELLYAYSDSALMLQDVYDIPLQHRLSILHNRANIYHELGKTRKMRNTFCHIIKLLPKGEMNDLRLAAELNLVQYHSNLTGSSTAHGDSAMQYAQHAMLIARRLQNPASIARAQIYLGTAYGAHKEQVQKALTLFDSSIIAFSELHDAYNRSLAQLQKAKTLRYVRAYAESMKSLDDVETLLAENSFPQLKRDVLEIKYDCLRESGDFQSALFYKTLLFNFEDSLRTQNSQAEMARLEVAFKLRETSYQMNLIQAENDAERRKKQVFATLTFLLILVLIFTVYVFINTANNRKRLAREKEMSLQLQLKDKELELSRWQQDAAQKSRMLTTKALALSEQNGFLQKLLDEAKSSPTGQDQHVLLQKLHQQLSSPSHWEDFEHAFTEVHPVFFETLLRLHPGLSEKERRMLAFAKIGLSTKEVASILHIEPSSVKMARYRLKKKFGLQNHDTLEDYLSHLT